MTKVVTVVKTKKGPHTHKKKGELMENDQDAMEVSYYHLTISKIYLLIEVRMLILLSLSTIKMQVLLSSPVDYPQSFCCVLQYSSEEEEVDLQTALTGFQTKQRKVLEPVDHGKIQYEPYRKNFYVEVPELAKMSQDGE